MDDPPDRELRFREPGAPRRVEVGFELERHQALTSQGFGEGSDSERPRAQKSRDVVYAGFHVTPAARPLQHSMVTTLCCQSPLRVYSDHAAIRGSDWPAEPRR
jgi:hypothetical protein